MGFDKLKFRKEIIDRLQHSRQHFADISDIVNRFSANDQEAKTGVERELVHLQRNMKILDIKTLDITTYEMDDDWLAHFKKPGVEVSGILASLTKDYFANKRMKLVYYAGIGLIAAILLIWALNKLF
ncbi:MAG: hypothetical protein JST58_08335 [Bacteroidetes bacterium]|nr:hypothetical protein [Bacteroidota bacterium]